MTTIELAQLLLENGKKTKREWEIFHDYIELHLVLSRIAQDDFDINDFVLRDNPFEGCYGFSAINKDDLRYFDVYTGKHAAANENASIGYQNDDDDLKIACSIKEAIRKYRTFSD
jgi:hypothetical protein